MDAILEADTKRFQNAMFRAGLDPSLKLYGLEMISALVQNYEADVDLVQAAAEFGFNKNGFENAFVDADRKVRPMLRRLKQGTIPRDQFENSYREVARAITDFEEIQAVAPPVKPAK